MESKIDKLTNIVKVVHTNWGKPQSTKQEGKKSLITGRPPGRIEKLMEGIQGEAENLYNVGNVEVGVTLVGHAPPQVT